MTGSAMILARAGASFGCAGPGVQGPIDGDQSAGRFAAVQYASAPRALAEPLHCELDVDSVPAPRERFGLTFPQL